MNDLLRCIRVDRHGARGLLLILTVTVILCGLASNPAAAAGDVSVRGATILRDGRPWLAKGLVLVGLVAPDNALKGAYLTASQHYGQAELNAAKQFGADLLRFQVSQAGNDPQSTIYSAAYAAKVKQAVALARSNGFAVIVSMQAEAPSGLDQKGMPSDATQRAWRTLTPLFAGDEGIMLELFNEPAPFGPTPHDWNGWLATTQPLVDEIRAMGAHNMLIADGLHYAQTLNGAPALNDPLRQIAYAAHPYFAGSNRTPQQWTANFGNLAATRPVLVTEWNASSKGGCNFQGVPSTAIEFLNYLRGHVGLVAWAFDYPGSLITGYDWKPTTLGTDQTFQCDKAANFGAGQLVHQYFTGQPLTGN
jgi:endoglucanase